ncbi:MAG: PEP/pyruvate-binding domain-containing protein, partial [Chloroflexota bacterium]
MTEPVVVRLADIRAADTETAGGKGANLGELIAAGFPVPDGFVLTTVAYDAAARAAEVDPSKPDDAAERLRASAVPARIANAALKA